MQDIMKPVFSRDAKPKYLTVGKLRLSRYGGTSLKSNP
jgi:hypothetical protein